MKSIKDTILEAEEFNPSFNTHKQAYNNLLKWYDKCLRHMSGAEIIDLLKTAVQNFEDDDFSNIQ